MARLPNAAKAVVDKAKLSSYVLNPDHPVGRNKARVFRATLGVTQDDAGLLEAALLAAAADEGFSNGPMRMALTIPSNL